MRSSSSRRRESSAPERRPRVEFYWWAECPSWERALADLRAAMVEVGLDPADVDQIEVTSEEHAASVGFPGSPTIRIDGEDVSAPREDMPQGLTCRVYLHRNRKISPLPDPLDLREALAAAAGVG